MRKLYLVIAALALFVTLPLAAGALTPRTLTSRALGADPL